MHYGWPSPSVPQLLEDNPFMPKITNEEGSWLAVITLVGSVFGSLCGSMIFDKYGRKNMILAVCVPFFLSWIMVAYATSVSTLMFARCIAGVADGMMFCGVPMYLGEIANPEIRGFLCASCSYTWILGILMINVFGSVFDIKTAALLSSLVPIICVFTFVWMPESPYYLIRKKRTDEARSSLRIFKGREDVEQELNRITKAIEEDTKVSSSYYQLFADPCNRKAAFIMMAVRGVQQMCGTTAITFYAQTIFKEAGDDVSPMVGSLIYFTIQLLMSMFCSLIVDKTGRKPLMVISLAGSGIALFIEGVFFYIQDSTEIETTDVSYIPLTFLIAFVILFGLGMQPIPIILLGELFRTDVKAFALSFIDIYFCFVATSVSKFFQIMKDDFGMCVPFFAFSLSSIIGIGFVIFYVPETKGKTLEGIQLMLAGNEEDSGEKNKEVKEVKANGTFKYNEA